MFILSCNNTKGNCPLLTSLVNPPWWLCPAAKIHFFFIWYHYIFWHGYWCQFICTLRFILLYILGWFTLLVHTNSRIRNYRCYLCTLFTNSPIGIAYGLWFNIAGWMIYECTSSHVSIFRIEASLLHLYRHEKKI